MILLISDENLWAMFSLKDNDPPRTCLTKRLIVKEVPPDKLLVINSLSGAIDLFYADEWKRIHQCDVDKNFESLPKSTYSFLARRGYLFFDANDEDHAFVSLMQYYRSKPSELQNSIIPALGCNFNCVYCFQPMSVRRHNLRMSEDQITTAHKIIGERISRSENKLLRVFGGEPLQLQNYSIIEKTLQFAAGKRLDVQITTNGFHLLEYIQLFKRFRNVSVYVQVTIDGVSRTHDIRRVHAGGGPSFKRIVNGVDALSRLPNTDITIRHNIDSETFDGYAGLLAFVKEKRWHLKKNIQFQLSGLFKSYDKSIRFPDSSDAIDIIDLYNSHIVPDPELDEHRFTTTSFSSEASYLATVFDFHVPGIHTRNDSFGPRVIYCHAAVDSAKYVFSPDGYVYNCLNLVGNKRFAIGRYSNGRIEIDDSSIQMWSERTITGISECYGCEMATLCGGGCAAERIWKDGELLKPSCHKDVKKRLLNRYLDEFIKRKLPSLLSSYKSQYRRKEGVGGRTHITDGIALL